MSEKMKMKEDSMEVDREQAECCTKLAECDHRLDDYEEKPTPGFKSTIASLMTFSFGFLFGLKFTLAERVVDSLYYGVGGGGGE